METLVVKRPRTLRTENTPIARTRIPSPPITDNDDDDDNEQVLAAAAATAARARDRWSRASSRDLLSAGVRSGEPAFTVEGFDEYQREDGLKNPPQGRAGGNDAFNLDYMREYQRRLNLIEKDPNTRFVNLVRGFLNGGVFEVIDEDAFRQGIERDIARAKEEARKDLTRAEQLNTLRREITDREKEQKRIEGEIKLLEQRSKLWQDAREAYVTGQQTATDLLKDNDKLVDPLSVDVVRSVMTVRNIKSSGQQLFDLMARVAFMKYGARGVLNRGFASDIEQFFRFAVAEAIDVGNFLKIKDNMPQIADVALYLAALKALTNSRGLLSDVAKTVRFSAGSAYSSNPELFATDVAVLSNMITPDVNDGQAKGPVTFKEITLLLHAHLNAMVEKSGLPPDQKIAKPVLTEQKRTASNKQKRTIFGKEVDVNVDDSTLQRAALGETNVFTEEELAAYQKKTFTNSEWIKTISVVQQLLMPLFLEGFGKLFFVDLAAHPWEDTSVYAESRYPADKQDLVRPVFANYRTSASQQEFSVGEIFKVASVILKTSDLALAYNASYYDDSAFASVSVLDYFRLLFERNNVASDWLRYELNLRNYIVKNYVLFAAAKLLGLMNNNISFKDGAVNRPVIFSEADVTIISEYLKLPVDASAKEIEISSNAVLEIFDKHVPVVTDQIGRNHLRGIYTTPSNRSFRAILNQQTGDPVFPVPDDLAETNDDLLNSIKKFRQKLNDNLSKTPEQIQQEIVDNLGGSLSSVNRRWASMPFNSGIVTLSSRFMACLGDATNIVRRNCPNLDSLSDEQLQRHPQTEVDFAHLVANKILIVNATNPGQYLRDNTIPDVKVLVRDNVNALRNVNLSSRCSSSFGRPTGTVSNVLPMKRAFRNYFR